MSQAELIIIRDKARKEGFEQGQAEGAAMVRASTILALREALKSKDTEADVLELVDHLGSNRGAFSFGRESDAKALADRLLGRKPASAGGSSETLTQAAERNLKENGLWRQGGGAVGAPQSPGDLGDQVVAVLAAKRGAK